MPVRWFRGLHVLSVSSLWPSSLVSARTRGEERLAASGAICVHGGDVGSLGGCSCVFVSVPAAKGLGTQVPARAHT